MFTLLRARASLFEATAGVLLSLLACPGDAYPAFGMSGNIWFLRYRALNGASRALSLDPENPGLAFTPALCGRPFITPRANRISHFAHLAPNSRSIVTQHPHSTEATHPCSTAAPNRRSIVAPHSRITPSALARHRLSCSIPQHRRSLTVSKPRNNFNNAEP